MGVLVLRERMIIVAWQALTGGGLMICVARIADRLIIHADLFVRD